jgi:hypothetical protein
LSEIPSLFCGSWDVSGPTTGAPRQTEASSLDNPFDEPQLPKHELLLKKSKATIETRRHFILEEKRYLDSLVKKKKGSVRFSLSLPHDDN